MAVGTTSTGKRSYRWLSTNHNHPSPNSSPFKRQRVSTMSQYHAPSPLSTTNATVWRISRYPEAKAPLHREVHAPCRPRKFDFSSNSSTESSLKASVVGNLLSENYHRAKYSALATVRLQGKGAVLENSKSVEEVHFIEEDGPQVRSVLTDHKLKESDFVETGVQVLDGKVEVVHSGNHQQSISSVVSELSNGKLNAVDAAKMMDTLSPEHDLSSVSAYKKLLLAVDKRKDNLSRLKYEIQLNEKRKSAIDLLRPKKELVEEVPSEPFIPLTKEEEVEVAHAFSAKWKEVLVTHEKSSIEISGEKFLCLRPGAWLNDDVINLYFELMKERERREPQKFLNCHFFNTFFYKRIISGQNGYDFKSVRRWTRQKLLGYGLHECDKIFVPIHKHSHWCLAVINKKDKKFQYLDSLKGMDCQVLEVLDLIRWDNQERHLCSTFDEVKDKTGNDIDISSWEKEFVEDIPEHENGYDCGMFMIKYADFYSRNMRLCFNQEHMPYFRLKTAKEILRLKAD